MVHSLTTLHQYFHNEQPEPIRGTKRLFPFERECLNCAILELISTSLREAAANDKPIFLHPKPKTRRDAIRNLRAFSSDYGERYRSDPPEGFEAVVPTIHINDCLGWMQLDGDQASAVFRGLRVDHRDLTKLPWYFAMVYKFVPPGAHQEDMIRSQYNFFYSAGLFVRHTKETTGAVPAFWWILPICSFHWPRSGENMTMGEGLRRNTASTVWNNPYQRDHGTRPSRDPGRPGPPSPVEQHPGRRDQPSTSFATATSRAGPSRPLRDPIRTIGPHSPPSGLRAPGQTAVQVVLICRQMSKLRKTLMQVAFRCYPDAPRPQTPNLCTHQIQMTKCALSHARTQNRKMQMLPLLLDANAPSPLMPMLRPL